jgi:hypothetical protein
VVTAQDVLDLAERGWEVVGDLLGEDVGMPDVKSILAWRDLIVAGHGEAGGVLQGLVA